MSPGSWETHPDLRKLRRETDREFREEAAAEEADATQLLLRSRTLANAAFESMVRGDEVTLAAGGREWGGRLLEAAGDLAVIDTGSHRVCVSLPALSWLRWTVGGVGTGNVAAGQSDQLRPNSGCSRSTPRALRSWPNPGGSVQGRVRAVGRDHVDLVGSTGVTLDGRSRRRGRRGCAAMSRPACLSGAHLVRKHGRGVEMTGGCCHQGERAGLSASIGFPVVPLRLPAIPKLHPGDSRDHRDRASGAPHHSKGRATAATTPQHLHPDQAGAPDCHHRGVAGRGHEARRPPIQPEHVGCGRSAHRLGDRHRRRCRDSRGGAPSPDFGQRFVTQDEMARVPGSVARREIAEGEPLLDTDLAAVSASEGLRAMSVPLDQGRAVGGGLSVGDRVDVIAVTEGVARFIATDVEVLQVPASEAGTPAHRPRGRRRWR